MRLILSAFARRDQDDIAEYTRKEWGDEQMDRYVGGLLDEFDNIAADPSRGRPVHKLPRRFLRITYGSHFIFYTRREDAVRIERVLHQRMDFQRRLR